MKTQILLSTLLIIGVTAAAKQPAMIQYPDTTQNTGITTTSDTVPADSSFTELENELNELNTEVDTTKIRVGKLKISVIDDGDDVIVEKEKKQSEGWGEWDNWGEDKNDLDLKFNKKFKPHWACFAMGVNSYLTPDFSMSLPDTAQYMRVNTNKSYEVTLNVAQLGIPIIKHRLGLVTGVGIKWNNYKFKNTQVRLKDDQSALYYEIATDDSYSKSKLTVSYLTVPLLIEYQIPFDEDPLYFSAGIEGGLKIGSHTKMKTNSGSKTKDKSDFHVSPFTATATARFGYGSFGIYGSYNLTPLFIKDEGPELYPFAIGVSINF